MRSSLNEDARTYFYENGFLIIENALAPREVRALVAVVNKRCGKKHKWLLKE